MTHIHILYLIAGIILGCVGRMGLDVLQDVRRERARKGKR